MERTATAWLALEAGGDAYAIGLLFAARMLPSLLLGLIAAALMPRRLNARHFVVANRCLPATLRPCNLGNSLTLNPFRWKRTCSA